MITSFGGVDGSHLANNAETCPAALTFVGTRKEPAQPPQIRKGAQNVKLFWRYTLSFTFTLQSIVFMQEIRLNGHSTYKVGVRDVGIEH